jgi:phosphohistidine phosphatase
MKTLLLLRHAKSSWDDPSLEDFDRPLAPRGEKAAPLMAAYLKKKGLRPDLVLCSPAARARQTWSLVAQSLGDKVEVKELQGLYLGAPSRLLEAVRRAPDAATCVMLVGHNPGMEHLAMALAGPSSKPKAMAKLHAKFPTAALAEIEFDAAAWRDIAPGAGRLTRFIRPKDLD